MRTYLKTYIRLTVVMVMLISAGCEDFLNKNLQGDLTQETFPSTASDVLLATNAVYATLRNENYHSGLFPLCDIMSDDASKGSNPNDQATVIGPYDNFTFNTTGDELDRWWATLYEGIKFANLVVAKVPDVTMDATLKNRCIAEARFLRALYYFDLVRAWGGVPLVLTLNPPLQMERATKEAVYAQVIADLEAAKDNLPEKSDYKPDEYGRATKGAAKALLAKVYLFNNDFTNAEKYAVEVIKSGMYDLEPVFTDANGVKGEHGVESVFEIGAGASEDWRGPGDQYANVQGVRGNPNRGWGFNRPTINFRNSFEANDPRLKGSIIDLGDTLDGIVITGDGTTPDVTKDDNANVIEVECYNRKVWTPGDNVISQWSHNRRLLRYADVLLMAAEACNENNKPADALLYVNAVRKRARQGTTTILPDITTTDKTLLRNAILDERRHELALEGHRFWDLVRTNKATEVLGPLGFVKGKHELFPIPQKQIDISQGLLKQNPNWE